MDQKFISKKTLDLITNLVKVARPVHWVKNIFVFAALIFSGTLFIPHYFTTTLWAFFAFCLTSSSAYIFNDILDADKDRLHPFKKKRPIASGKLPIKAAVIESLVLAITSVLIAGQINSLFLLIIITYLVLQILYSLYLKQIAVVDILIIASGFVLRVYGGAFAINVHLSVWFLLCVISISLFLASGKRRAELNTVLGNGINTRDSLSQYKRGLLNSYVTMFGDAAWVSWALFTFFESPSVKLPLWVLLAEISKTITINKLMMITIPLVIFGIMRYQYLIFKDQSERPEKVLLSDIPLVTTVLIWGIIVIWILYSGVALYS